MYVASRILQFPDGTIGSGSAPSNDTRIPTDISGSILINAGSKLDLNGGGRIDQSGKMALTAKGGNLSLRSDTMYFQTSLGDGTHDLSGFRVPSLFPFGATAIIDNPGQINARIAIDPNAIEAYGFGGGGTFTLETPQIQFGNGTAAVGTELPLNFFSTAGFASYNITSYKTDLSPSTFTNNLGGYNAVLATQTLTVGAGQSLSLIQSVLPNFLTAAQNDALRNLASGGNVMSVVSPVVPSDAWDQAPINLTLGGLIELHVAQGGSIIGAAGGSITASKLFNEGTIRIPGGTITQREVLPGYYGSSALPTNFGNRHVWRAQSFRSLHGGSRRIDRSECEKPCGKYHKWQFSILSDWRRNGDLSAWIAGREPGNCAGARQRH
ncbi:MAG: hypothetical protein WDN50_06410 [Bradyrhizobium sp.]